MRNYRYITAFAVVLAVVILLILIFNYRKAQNRLNMTDAAIATAETVVSFYRGANTIDALYREHGLFLSSALRTELENFDLALRQLEDVYIDLDAFYTAKLSLEDRVAVGSPTFVDDLPKVIGIDRIGADEPKFSPLITKVNGVRKIRASQLEFRTSGTAYVLYNGMFLEIVRETVPESYEMMLRNPRHTYRYADHLVNLQARNAFVDVLLVSIFDGRPERIRVRVRNGKVVGFEVL